MGSVQASEVDLGSSEPGAAGMGRKNKTKVGHVQTHKEGRLANVQAQKTQVKGTKHYHRRAWMWPQSSYGC